MSDMRPLPAVVAAFFCLPLLAQTPYSERIEVSVVNVDVTVTDWHGKPVRGLTKDDFEVLEDGVPQAVTNFYAVDRESAQALKNDERFRRKVLVLIDTFSTTPFERNQALAHLESLINDQFQTGDYDWSIAALDTELRLLLPPTSDKEAIHNALNQIRANHAPPMQSVASQPLAVTPLETFGLALQEREDREAVAKHVHAILDAVRAFGATTGKKAILFLTARALPVVINPRDLEAARTVTEIRNDLIREANASNVNLYIVNPGGIASGDPSMYWIARETGGRYMPSNNVSTSLQQFDARSSNFYSLGYRAPHPDDSKYHQIEVRVKSGHYRLQYRDGYASLASDKQLNRTMHSAFGAFMLRGSDLPVTLGFGPLRNVPDGVIAMVKTSVPADQLVFLPLNDGKSAHVEISISVFDATGHSVWHVVLARDAGLKKDEAPSGVFTENTEVELSRNTPYRVVIAVRDLVSDSVGVTQQIVQF